MMKEAKSMATNGFHLRETPKIRKIAFVGDHLPRKCGIATFTTDLLSAGRVGHFSICHRLGRQLSATAIEIDSPLLRCELANRIPIRFFHLF
jgi:hypothetical protein